MKRNFYLILALVLVTSVETACAYAADQTVPFDCKSPNGKEIYEYKEISGVVSNANVRDPVGDCFSDCPPDMKSSYYAVLKQPTIDSEASDKTIIAFTPEENDRQLREKPRYMEIGKTYRFCARPAEDKETTSTGELIFLIDDLSSIRIEN